MFNRRSLVFLVLAIFFGTAAVFATRNYLAERAPAELEPLETVQVVTAAHDLGVGTALRGRDLGSAQWPKESVPEGTFLESEILEGRVLKRAVIAGEPIFEATLLPEGAKAGLSSVIAPDHRAVSVKVDAVVGIAGFVKPGARVDVLATLHRENAPTFSNVIVQDVRVLAVDQQMEEAKEGKPEVVNVATLEVTTQEAQRLIHAAHEGKLQLALRNPGDEKLITSRAIGAQQLVGDALRVNGNATKQAPTIQVIKGTSVSRVRY